MGAARQAWLAAHPWLAPVATFQEVVDAPLDAGGAPPAPAAGDLRADGPGVPLLAGPGAERWVEASAAALGTLLERVAAARLPGAVGEGARALRDAIRSPSDRRAAIARLLVGVPAAERHAGLLRLLGWAAVRHAVAGTSEAAAGAALDRWGRAGCPTCGALPAMAQLAARDEGRARQLACGRCRTRWAWQRTGCPFCGNEAPDRFQVLELDGDDRLRLDVCAECHGYLKTYAGEGEEELFLADWPTLHLDVLARERGLERRGASLYEI